MTREVMAFEYVCSLPYLPSSREGSLLGRPSKSEIRRWFKNGSVIINSKKVSLADKIMLPIWELVFFKGSSSQNTFISQ